ncbi:glycoside hydrolase superfamily [Gongronella butleri]|nr:glycoside hydrolase superfamily [Gongronella butleri]
MVQAKYLLGVAATMALAACQVQAAGIPSNAVVEYWGQNSANNQKNLAFYCDESTDVLVLSFLMEFNVGGLPGLNFANTCETFFDGTTLLNCPQIGDDIKTCQSKGKTILLSLGGAAGAYGFTSDDQAKTFAQTLYTMFGKGSGAKYRPFGDANVDGFDFDIEGGGATGYATLAKSLKSLDSSILITGAPQCPFPDAMMGDALDNAPFDAVWVQFYNNYCSAASSSFNFDTWDNWAKTKSPNKDVKIFLGLPGSSTAADSGYLSMSQIQSTIDNIKQYSSYGGVMFWDASQTYSNTDASPNLAAAVGSLVHGGSSASSGNSTSSSSNPTTAPTTIATSGASSTATSTNSKATSSIGATTTSMTLSATVSPSVTVSPSPVATASYNVKSTSCIQTGDACGMNNRYACAGKSFGICDNGKWVLQSCAAGLTCFSTTDGASVYCAQPSDNVQVNNTCTSPSSAVAPKAYNNNMVQAQLSVTNSTATSWTAVINARRTMAKPFGSKVVVSFKLPTSHMSVDSVSNGVVSKSGLSITFQVNNPYKKSMDLVFTVHGSIEKGTVFVAPSSNNLRFQ